MNRHAVYTKQLKWAFNDDGMFIMGVCTQWLIIFLWGAWANMATDVNLGILACSRPQKTRTAMENLRPPGVTFALLPPPSPSRSQSRPKLTRSAKTGSKIRSVLMYHKTLNFKVRVSNPRILDYLISASKRPLRLRSPTVWIHFPGCVLKADVWLLSWLWILLLVVVLIYYY